MKNRTQQTVGQAYILRDCNYPFFQLFTFYIYRKEKIISVQYLFFHFRIENNSYICGIFKIYIEIIIKDKQTRLYL